MSLLWLLARLRKVEHGLAVGTTAQPQKTIKTKKPIRWVNSAATEVEFLTDHINRGS